MFQTLVKLLKLLSIIIIHNWKKKKTNSEAIQVLEKKSPQINL